MRRSIWEAMFSATSCALSSGCLISWMEIRTRFPNRFSRSSRSWSTDEPPLPMTMPGLAVWMGTVSWAFVDEQLLDHQVFAIEVEVVLGVGSRGLDRLGDIARGVLGRELQVRQGFRHLHAFDGVGHEPRFARRAAHVPLHC